MADFAFKKKAVNMQTPKDHMVEMTPEVHKMKNQLVNIQSKWLLQASALASHRRAVDQLKEKSNFWKERAKQKLFKIELGNIMESTQILDKIKLETKRE